MHVLSGLGIPSRLNRYKVYPKRSFGKFDDDSCRVFSGYHQKKPFHVQTQIAGDVPKAFRLTGSSAVGFYLHMEEVCEDRITGK